MTGENDGSKRGVGDAWNVSAGGKLGGTAGGSRSSDGITTIAPHFAHFPRLPAADSGAVV